jgi:hypothetical protein
MPRSFRRSKARELHVTIPRTRSVSLSKRCPTSPRIWLHISRSSTAHSRRTLRAVDRASETLRHDAPDLRLDIGAHRRSGEAPPPVYCPQISLTRSLWVPSTGTAIRARYSAQ